MVKRKLFVPNTTPKFPGQQSLQQFKGGPSFKTSLSSIKAIDEAISAMAPNYKEQVMQATIDAFNSQYKGGKVNQWNGNKTSSNSGSKPNNQPSTSTITVFRDKKANNSYALSKAPNPKPISLNSGVKPNAFANDYMDAVENTCSPLHLHVSRFYIPTGATNPLSTYFKNNIAFDVQTRAQYNAGFGLDVSTKLTSDQIATAYNAVLYALQAYFYYSSILSYESDTRNKNAGMTYLRQQITTTILSDVQQLGRRLQDTPIPPHMVEWMRYMNGNFLSSDTQGAPLLKIAPNYSSIGMTTSSTNVAAAALAALNTDANNTVYTLLRKAIPQWRTGILYDCPPTPTYDKNFITIFNNASSVCKPGAAVVYSSTVTNLDTNVQYNSYHNKLDGVAYAMTNVYISANAEFYPGIMVPQYSGAVSIDSKVSYYNVGGVKGFYAAALNSFITHSRQDCTSYDTATAITPHLFGSDRCQGVNGAALLASGQDSLEFLFNVDKIPLKGTVANFNRGA